MTSSSLEQVSPRRFAWCSIKSANPAGRDRSGWLQSAAIAALTLFCIGSLSGADAEVVINEIGAASSDRLLRSHPDGRPRLGWGPSWCDADFDDADWGSGAAPFGFGAEGIVTDLGDEMRGRTPSLYLRKTFTVAEDVADRFEPFLLSARADSGFVAYINGREIARANLGEPNLFVYHVQSAFSSAQADETLDYVSTVLPNEVLKPGENVLAVQVQNTVPAQINERDTSIDERLIFEASLAIGDPAAGAPVDIPLSAEGWRYRVGHAEPSGGVVDWTLAALPELAGEFSDWIELHNKGNEAVDLSGWHLTDDQDLPKHWAFPQGTVMEPGAYLLVLADGQTTFAGDYLHTSFGLSSRGEYLALNDATGETVDAFDDGFPRQYPFQSYGRSAAGAADEYVYFERPSPGAVNVGPELLAAIEAPEFSLSGGVYDNTVDLELQTDTEGVEIRYTLDGREPNQTNGTLYESPIRIAAIDDRTGTVVRARAFKAGMVPSEEGTQTYLVGVDDVFKGIPALSLVADPGEAFYKPHGVLSIVGRNVPTAVSEYYMPAMHGRSFERQVSTEWIYPDRGLNIQQGGGLRLSASAFSRGNFFLENTDASPWVSRAAEKPSFNLFYRGDYGGAAVDHSIVENYPVSEFRQFRLRAGKNDIVNPFITDELARRVFIDMGQFGAKGMQCALFVNGSYKGYYNPVARLREGLFQDVYGRDNPWQVKHIDVWADGSPHANKLQDTPEWDQLEALLSKDLRLLEHYEALTQELDPVNFADYFILNIYGATLDWPHNNFVLARELESAEGRWRAYVWDAEGMFGVESSHGLTHDSIKSELENGQTSPSDDLATVWRGLIKSPEWKLLFADRLQKHFFTPGGALTKGNLRERRDELAGEVTDLLAFSGETMDPGEITEWIEGREAFLFDEGEYWASKGLWLDTEVPFFDPPGGTILEGESVTIAVAEVAKRSAIYYTTDGSDPRLPGGDLNPNALKYEIDEASGVVLEGSVSIKARVRISSVFDSSWGALGEASFNVGVEPASPGTLWISELMANPSAPSEAESAAGYVASDFEFIEFYNAGDVAIDLASLRFTDGIAFDFSDAELTTIPAESYAILVSHGEAFRARYGNEARVLGAFERKLSNEGERLELADGLSGDLWSLDYSNEAPWPEPPEERGYSLVFQGLEEGKDPQDPSHWRYSSAIGGTPGQSSEGDGGGMSPETFYQAWLATHFSDVEQADSGVSGMAADPDGDGSSNLLEFGMGSDPRDAASLPSLSVGFEEGPEPSLTLQVTLREEVGLQFAPEFSSDMNDWAVPAADEWEEIATQVVEGGLRVVTYRVSLSSEAEREYVRWRVRS